MTTETPESVQAQPAAAGNSRSPRGRWLVIGLLLFGSLATAGISTYWKVRLGPYGRIAGP